MALDPVRLRSRSQLRLRALDLPVPPPDLDPLFDEDVDPTLRPAGELIERAAVLHVVVARVFGMPAPLAQLWIADNDLGHALSPTEAELIDGTADPTRPRYQVQIEALWGIAWVLGLAPHLDPTQYCDSTLHDLLPDLRGGESLIGWKTRLPEPRSIDEVVTELDLLLCITWGLAQTNDSGEEPPGVVEQYVPWERRRALEWSIAERGYSSAAWDVIDLPT